MHGDSNPAARPARHLAAYGQLFPDAWRLYDQFREARGRTLPDWPGWCFAPLSAAYAIVSRGGGLRSIHAAREVGILGALAAWRPTQGVYRFDPTMLDALWATPIEGEIPSEVLYRLPEWCVYLSTPGRRWGGDELHGFWAHLEHDANDGRAELRLVLDTTGPDGEQLIPIPIHLDRGGLAGGIAATIAEGLRQAIAHRATPAEIAEVSRGLGPYPPDPEGQADLAPLVSLVLYLGSEGADVAVPTTPGRVPDRPGPRKVKTGWRLFPPDRPTVWHVGDRLGDALRRAIGRRDGGREPGDRPGPRPHIRGAHWHSFWTGSRRDPEARSLVLRWLPPIPVNLGDDEGHA